MIFVQHQSSTTYPPGRTINVRRGSVVDQIQLTYAVIANIAFMLLLLRKEYAPNVPLQGVTKTGNGLVFPIKF